MKERGEGVKEGEGRRRKGGRDRGRGREGDEERREGGRKEGKEEEGREGQREREGGR